MADPIPCKQWSDCGFTHAGCCSLGFGPNGKPPKGYCLKFCTSYDGPARGAGDIVRKITEVTGIKAGVDMITKATGKPCNCDKRQIALNNALPSSTIQPKD